MSVKGLTDLLIRPHSSITNPETRRVILLLSAYHLFTIPLGGLLYLHRPDLPLMWTLGIFICCVCFYGLSRSPWSRALINIQIFMALTIPAVTSVIEPDRQSVHFAYMVPVLVSTLLYALRYLYVVSALSLIVFLTMTSMYPPADPSLTRGSLLLLIVLISMVILSKHHVRWQEQQRERKKIQERERYFTLVDAAFDGTATILDGVFTNVSEGFATVFSLSPTALENMSVAQFLRENLKDSEEIGPQLKLVTANNSKGELRFVQMIHDRISDPLSENAQIMAVRDVTLEQDMNIQKLIMERLTSAGMVASSIAHEMNTPLMIAQRQIDLATQSNGLETSVSKRLTSATSALEQIESILGDLRWFIQSNARNHTQDPALVIENSVKLARHRIQYETDILLNLESIPPVSISAGKLSQIVINLIFNASKARRPEQTIVHIRIDASTTDDDLVLEISDNGCGIPGHLQQRVFEPFFTSRMEEGMGLGLAICQSLVREARGRISLRSEVGEGTRFCINLPLAKDKMAEQSFKHADQKEPLRILVIDDNDQLLDIISEMLLPNIVHACTTVAAAKQAISNEHFSAVICDITMPQGGAVDLFKYLDARQNELKEKLVFITGARVDASSQRYIKLLNRPILYKPFTREALLRALSEVEGKTRF